MRKDAPGPDEAVTYLLQWALLEIRFLAARKKPSKALSPAQSADFTRQIYVLADTFMPFPSVISARSKRKQRKKAVKVLEGLWVFASPELLEWSKRRLDKIGYDWRPLTPIREAGHARMRAEGFLD